MLFQIKLDNRYNGNTGSDCLLSVDGTDFRIPERGRDWYSHKFKKSAVRYEIALGIKTGDICWLSGPHQPGIWRYFATLSSLILILMNVLRQMMVMEEHL